MTAVLGYQHNGQFVCARCWARFVGGRLWFVAKSAEDPPNVIALLRKSLERLAQWTEVCSGSWLCGECNEGRGGGQ